MSISRITENIIYTGVDDKDIDLFESQYKVENGISYNSYVIIDDKIAIMDTVDIRAAKEWKNNVKEALGDRKPDYLVISHMEPDHAANIKVLTEEYPDMKLVGNAKTFPMLMQFFDIEGLDEKKIVVKEGDSIVLGEHELSFYMAPMVHWPEVMVTYEKKEKILFSADGFGKFGTLDTDEPWEEEASRYYFNIVGKYGAQVQALLKKAATLEINTICPLHGPVLKENIGWYIDKYNKWSSYEPDKKGVLIAYASIHGNTKKAALELEKLLKESGEENVSTRDLSRDDMSEAVEEAFRYDRLVLACATYDAGLFPPMEDFINHLKSKGYKNRKVGLMENGSWAPMAAKLMTNALAQFKDINICEAVVTIKSALKESDKASMKVLVDELRN